jgi:hypothetical protein
MQDKILGNKHALFEFSGNSGQGLKEAFGLDKVKLGPFVIKGAGGGEYEVIAAAGVGNAGVRVLEVELLEFGGFVLEGVGKSVADVVEELLVELLVH